MNTHRREKRHTDSLLSENQLELPWQDETSLVEALRPHVALPIELILTDNSSSMVSYRRIPGLGLRLRLHRMFLGAPPHIVRALGRWLDRPERRADGHLLDQYIRAHRHLLREPLRTSIRPRTRGRCYDLADLFEEVNREHFGGGVTAVITWGRRHGSKRKRRSIRFGSYSARTNTIRIHPALDSPRVPAFFVRFIMFHEMLHARLGISEDNSGRQRIHTAEFKRLEQAFPDYAAATAWQKEPANLRLLLAS